MNYKINNNNKTDEDGRQTPEKQMRYMLKLKKQAKYIHIKQDGSRSRQVRVISTSWYYINMFQIQ